MPENAIKKDESLFVKAFNENKYILLSCLVAFIITQLVAFCYNLVPYGDMTILRMDLYHQYGPLFAELYDRLTSGSSLVYSWNSGLGSSFLGNYFNYLSSPLTLIILIFGHKNITEAISCLIMLKAILSAGSFTYYLKASYKKSDASTAAFGVLYAFSGYFVAYYWNLMWLDAMILFPIIILGIEKIVKNGKPALYCISLAVMIFANYYMAYMICIFSVLYYFCYYFQNYTLTQKFVAENPDQSIKGRFKNSVFLSSALKFGLFSMVAGLLAAVAIVPLITILSGSSATGGNAPSTIVKYFTTFDFLANHLAGPDATIRSSGDTVLPNVYCGIITLILVPLYIYSKKISVKEKVINIGILAILYFSFDINILNFVWHGFHFPNDLPYRFSFMYVFMLLIMAYKAFVNIKEFTARQILSVGVGLVFFIILTEKITSKNIGDISLALSLVFAVGYVIVLNLFRNKKFQTSAVAILLLCCVSSEIALADTNNYSMNQSKTNYTVDYDEFKATKKAIDEYDGNGFYRMELTDLRTRMDPCWFNYNGASTFSSMAYEKVANLQQKVGLYGNYINSYTYMPQTPVYNTFFGLKYIVDNTSDDLSCNYYTKIIGENRFTAYENNYYLPVAFAANAEICNWQAESFDNPIAAQSELFRAASGVDGVFERLEIEDATYTNLAPFFEGEFDTGSYKYSKEIDNLSGSVCFEITPSGTQNVYIYADCKNLDSITVSSAMYTKTINSLDEPHITDLGVMNAGETIFVDIDIKDSSNTGNLDFCAYTVNDTKFKEGYEYLKPGEFNINAYNDTTLSGTISVDRDCAVFTSIPYDQNWHIYIDGKQLSRDNIFKISDALLGFNITQGEHTLVLKYKSIGLTVGSIISAVTVIIALIVIIRRRNKPVINRWKNLENEEFTVLVEDEKENIQPDVTQTDISEDAVLLNDSEQDCFEIDIEKAFDENEIITETQENEQE